MEHLPKILYGNSATALVSGICFLLAGICLFVLDKSLSPHRKEYPCANPLLRIVIRFHVFSSSIRGVTLLSAIGTARARNVPLDVLLNSFAELSLFGVITWLVVSNPLNGIAWARLVLRFDRAKASTRKGKSRDEKDVLALEAVEGLDVAPYVFRSPGPSVEEKH